MTISSPPDLDALAALPKDAEGPLFAEPWQAQAFAMAVQLREDGVFTWTEWCQAMNAEIAAAQAAGDPDLGDTYYHHWLRALERLVTDKGMLDAREIAARHAAWDAAHRATPYGEPVHLEQEDPDHINRVIPELDGIIPV